MNFKNKKISQYIEFNVILTCNTNRFLYHLPVPILGKRGHPLRMLELYFLDHSTDKHMY